MKHQMIKGDVWCYTSRIDDSYYIFLGNQRDFDGKLCWEIYNFLDFDLDSPLYYEDEIFQSVVNDGNMKLVSRVV